MPKADTLDTTARAFAAPTLTPRRPSGPPPKIASTPKPPPAPKPGRRALLAGIAALLPAAAVASAPAFAASAPHPDAELIALCRAYSDEVRRYFALPEDANGDTDDALIQPILYEQARLVSCLEEVHARTADGILARAALLHEANMLACEDGSPDRVSTWDVERDRGPGQLLAQLLRDAAALAALPRLPYTPSTGAAGGMA